MTRISVLGLLAAFAASVSAFSFAPEPIPANDYVSRSTADPEASTNFSIGSADRRARLEEALSELGVDSEVLTTSPEFRGSAALRMYASFVLPKSEGALAVAESPQRAAVVANSIAFMVREHRAHREEWLRNHDRSLEEAAALLPEGAGRHPMTIVLDNVRSAHNVGNILRAAEAGRLDRVVLCGITPAPPDAKVLKTALGAAEYVPYKHVGSTFEAIGDLKKNGVSVWGVETTSKSEPLWKVALPQPVAFVFGNELVGVDAEVLNMCDGILSVPTYGVKNSLNVATCASILVWEALRQWDIGSENAAAPV